MDSSIPYGTQWIKDLVPNVTWDNTSQSIVMPDGSTLPKSAYTIVDSKAYVKPDAVSKYITNTGATTGANTGSPGYVAPTPVSKVQTASAPTSGTVWIRDLDPGASWDQNTQSITLSNGTVLPKSIYTLVGGKAYVNPYAIASYYTPDVYNAENTQAYIDKTTDIYSPIMDHSYDRLNTLISTLQNKLKANTNNINAQADVAQNRLEAQQNDAAAKLMKQAMARGTYTSGVADYQQEQLAGDYAQQYEDLANTVAANIASANTDISGQMSDLGSQATSLEDSFMEKILGLVSNLMGNEYTQQNNKYQNIINSGTAALTQGTTDLQSAIARTELFGKVTTDADAKLLGVPVGTSSYQALSDAAALSARSSSSVGSSGGSSGGLSGSGIDLSGLTTDQKRSFDAAMRTWEQTGVAPVNPVLQAYGVAAGTGYTPEIAASINENTGIDNMIKSLSLVANKDAKGNAYSSNDTEAAATALVRAGKSQQAAVNYLIANRDEYEAAGVNVDNAIAIIKKYFQKGDTSNYQTNEQVTPNNSYQNTYDNLIRAITTSNTQKGSW